jgi:hypothetical protein
MNIVGAKLGAITAENDHEMLDEAFLETADYRTIIESKDKIIIIGRRGTGKSALTYKISKQWRSLEKSRVIVLAPQEDQVIGIRSILEVFENNYGHIKSTVKMAWEAVLILEILNSMKSYYKFEKLECAREIKGYLEKLYKPGKDISSNLRNVIKFGIAEKDKPLEAIADFSESVNLPRLKESLKTAISDLKMNVFLLIDCLDEGYEPDTSGIAYVAGIMQGTLNISTIFSNVRPVLFLRDNMFRAVANADPDYTRNFEQHVHRLHWGDAQLLNLAVRRIKVAFNLTQENDIRIWNRITDGILQNQEGFRRCLKLTLYRPRDLLSLLNQAIFNSLKENRNKLIEKDIEDTAKEISESRLRDLKKEYEVIFPMISNVVDLFDGFKPEFSAAESRPLLQSFMTSEDVDFLTKKDLAFFSEPDSVIKALYSVGFLGVRERDIGAFSFCHDGRDPDLIINGDTQLLIHPCYQVALNLVSTEEGLEASGEIHDDYEIEVTSFSQEVRNKLIGQLVSRISAIEEGAEGAGDFENWCLEALQLIFAGELNDIKRHPNGNAPQRRDIVGTNVAEKGFWKRIRDDYGSRDIIFETKNYETLAADDFRQLGSYLADSYGRVGFFITRMQGKEPSREQDLVWVREIYWKQDKRLIIILSYKHLIAFLEKIRNPQKHDAVDKLLTSILTTYNTNYLNEPSARKSGRKK